MRLTTIPRTLRHLRRYRQIIAVFLKYGFDEMVDVARKDLALRFGRKIIPRLRGKVKEGMSRGERLRHAAEELGPTFIKMGQILSLRPEIIPPDIALEFQQLQDRVTPLPFDDIRAVIQEELGHRPEEVFSEIAVEPLAAASMAQVHKAKLQNGQPVVIKVQRPGITETIEVDIEILTDLAHILSRRSHDLPLQDPAAVVSEFDRSIHRELDFLQEGRNIHRFGQMFADDPNVFIPTYYPDLSTERVLVMDYVDGIKVSDLDQISAAGLDPVIIAQRGAGMVLRQIFEYGFFHADPHPGNIMVLADNVIAPLDYGMVGYLNEPTIEELSSVLVGVVQKDVRRILRSFEQLGISHQPERRDRLLLALTDFINRYCEVPLKQLQVSALMSEIFDIVQEHHLTVPPNLSLMLRTMVTAEGTGKMLNPDFDMVSEVRPYLKKIAWRKFDPRRRLLQGMSILDDMYRLVEEFPESVRDILNKAKYGQLKIQFEHRNLDKLVAELNRSASRIASALIVAALIVGSSLVMQVSLGPSIFGFPLLGVAGYLLASLLGLKLIWDILKSSNI